MADPNPLSQGHTSTSEDPEEMDATLGHLQKQNETSVASCQARQKVERETELLRQKVTRARKDAKREATRVQWRNPMGAWKDDPQWWDDMEAMDLQFHRKNEAINFRHKQELEDAIKYQQKKALQAFALLGGGLVTGFVTGLFFRSFLHRGPRLRGPRYR